MKTRWKLLAVSLLAPGLLGVSASAYSQAADFYKAKVLNIIFAGGPAGGHTRYARLIGPYLQKHTGAREVLLTNKPGGGGIQAAHQRQAGGRRRQAGEPHRACETRRHEDLLRHRRDAYSRAPRRQPGRAVRPGEVHLCGPRDE